jgi:uncharacterized membrane protein YdjX (TVP38/TMEM64 family)
MPSESSESYPEPAPERDELELLDSGVPVDAAGELTADLQPAGRGGIPRRFVLRFLFLVALIVTGFALLRLTPLAGLLQEGALVAAFERLRASPWAPVALILSYVLLCPFGVPATPMMIAGGVIFGIWRGSLYNLAGTFLGAAATYYLARHLGRDFLVHLLGGRLKRVEKAVARQGFWGLLRVRFLPLPFALVNYSAALAGVRPAPYLASTAIGLAPTSVLFTYFAAALFRAAAGERSGMVLQLLVATLALLLLTFVPNLWTARRRKRRYRELLARRRDRRQGG